MKAINIIKPAGLYHWILHLHLEVSSLEMIQYFWNAYIFSLINWIILEIT